MNKFAGLSRDWVVAKNLLMFLLVRQVQMVRPLRSHVSWNRMQWNLTLLTGGIKGIGPHGIERLQE